MFPDEFPQRLVTVTNGLVPRPSATSLAVSQAKQFLFSTSWKYQRVPIWLKTLNLKGYTAKYRYRKGLDVYALAKRKSQTKTKSQPKENCMKWIECNGVNFGVNTKFKFRYLIVKLLLVWLNQFTGLHPPMIWAVKNIFPLDFIKYLSYSEVEKNSKVVNV